MIHNHSRFPVRSLLFACCALLLLLATPALSQELFPTPTEHEFALLGTERVMLYHTAVFEDTNEAYQMILEVSIPPMDMVSYSNLMTHWYYVHEGWTWMTHSADAFTLPALAAGSVTEFSGSIFLRKEGQADLVLSNQVPFTVERVMYFRRFDLSADDPAELTYLLFGTATDTYMAHYLTRRGASSTNPDPRAFDNIVRVAYPTWLPPMPGDSLPSGNDLLRAVLEVKVPSVSVTTLPTESPLTLAVYPLTVNGDASYAGRPFVVAVLNVMRFDTQHLNGSPAGSTSCRPSGMHCTQDSECCSTMCRNYHCSLGDLAAPGH